MFDHDNTKVGVHETPTVKTNPTTLREELQRIIEDALNRSLRAQDALNNIPSAVLDCDYKLLHDRQIWIHAGPF